MADSSLVSAQVSMAALNRALEGYRVLRQVGHGAMGIVYEAEQVGLNRRVALKVLPPNLALRERTVKRFLREAESMGKLGHPNVVDVYEVGSKAEFHFFTMKFVEGPSLDRVLKAGPLGVQDVIGIGIDVATALAHAHARGVLHRDVKPGNLLRDREKILLTDFGLARQIEGEEGGSVTESGDLVGTPLYMSPEQISGEFGRIDGRADIWGLGVTLYELLADKAPFTGNNASAILHAILHREPPNLRKLRQDVPRDLDAVIHKCLEKDPARRYPTAAALLDDLAAVRAGRPVAARTPRFFDPAARWVRNHPKLAGGAVATTLVVIVLGFILRNVVVTVLERFRNVAEQATEDKQKAERERDDTKRERDIQERERIAASARRMIADARMLWWSEGTTDDDRRAAFEGIFDVLQAPALNELPEIRAEVFEFAAELALAQQRSPEQVLALLEPQFASLDESSALMFRAAVLTGLKQFQQALAVHSERMRRRPLDPQPWIEAARVERRMGGLELESGDFVEADLRLRRAISLLGNALDRASDREVAIHALVERARCRLDLAQPEFAIRDLQRALAQDPNHVDAQAALSAAERMARNPVSWSSRIAQQPLETGAESKPADDGPRDEAQPESAARERRNNTSDLKAREAQKSLEAIYGVFEGLIRGNDASASGAGEQPKRAEKPADGE
ncbi:MAG: protein kinase [Planctomycetes bacterium]|nr:protein kinase [Planctomycetota bacterium]